MKESLPYTACTGTGVTGKNLFFLTPGTAGKGGKMGVSEEKKDIVEKEFLAFPDIAADVINALLYQGKPVAGGKNLLAGPTETVYQGGKKLRSQYEDLCKYELADGEVKIVYLIANQSRTDGKMLLRKAGYTGGIYREQYEGKAKEVYPVIELVLYWGNPRWRGARDMRKMFKRKLLPEETWKYIDDIKLHVFEMRHLPEETRKLFKSDMRIVADFLAEGDNYRSDRKVTHKAVLIKMIRVLSGESSVDDVEDWLEGQGIREEDEVTVCELFDQYERKGRREGKIEGIAEGERRGLELGEKRGLARGEAGRLVKDVESAMKFFKVTLEKACEGLGTTVSGYEEARKICFQENEVAL